MHLTFRKLVWDSQKIVAFLAHLVTFSKVVFLLFCFLHSVHMYSTFYKLICLSARSWCFNLVIRFKKSYMESIGKASHTNNSLLSLISITGLMFYITYFNNWLLYSPKIINWIQHLSQFGDIYLEEYFIKYLKSGIQVWVFDMKKILSILLRNRIVHFIGFGNRLSLTQYLMISERFEPVRD